MLEEKKAVILLSTYNGEKYIGTQLHSILNQTYKNFELLIRDDGSSDNTKEIIQEYKKLDSRITFIEDDNRLGYPKCFYYLTNCAPNADFYFFCDQDDYWYSDKIERAISVLSKGDSSLPLAYYSRYAICDSDLKINKISPKVCAPTSLYQALFEVCGLEFTMCINRTALQLLYKYTPKFCTGRGTWMCMLYSALGNIICDDYVSALYRRHSETTTSPSQGGIGLMLWRIKTFFSGGFAEYRDIILDFYQCTYTKLDKKSRRMLHFFVEKKYYPNFILKTFYPKRFRRKLIDEIALRLSFFIGQL